MAIEEKPKSINGLSVPILDRRIKTFQKSKLAVKNFPAIGIILALFGCFMYATNSMLVTLTDELHPFLILMIR